MRYKRFSSGLFCDVDAIEGITEVRYRPAPGQQYFQFDIILRSGERMISRSDKVQDNQINCTCHERDLIKLRDEIIEFTELKPCAGRGLMA